MKLRRENYASSKKSGVNPFPNEIALQLVV